MTLRPPRALLWSWAGLLGLLALTVTLAYQPLSGLVALLIALAKALVVAVVFMELRAARPLVIAFAGAGFFWLAILLWLSATDFMTRPDFPPRLFPLAAVGAAGAIETARKAPPPRELERRGRGTPAAGSIALTVASDTVRELI